MIVIWGGNKMCIKLFNSEIKVMEVLWREGEVTAGQIAKILKEEIGWNRNTTYTVIKKCIEKGAIERREPNYICKSVISREYIQQVESTELIDKMFAGSIENFFAAYIQRNKLSTKQIEHLKQIVEEME